MASRCFHSFLSFILIFSLFTFFGCSKKADHQGEKYKLEEIKKMMEEGGATELPKKIEEGGVPIPFSEYSPGVNQVESYGLRYQRLVFFAISFETEEMAKNEALRLNQYYTRNWVIDRVEGEPLLEDVALVALKAINPTKKVQRVPKTHPHAQEHGEEHKEAKGGGEHH